MGGARCRAARAGVQPAAARSATGEDRQPALAIRLPRRSAIIHAVPFSSHFFFPFAIYREEMYAVPFSSLSPFLP
jgi:hypothetical protein